MDIIQKLTEEFNLKLEQVEKTVALIDEGNTIPFIARYRKEVTGSLDDVVLRDLNDRLAYLRSLDKRREEVRSSIAEQGKLTDEISAAIDNAAILTELEDIYRPFKPHRKTRASVAREKGLEPLAALIMEQRASYSPSIEEEAANYINEEKEVNSAEEALQGARDIIAEDISDNADFRKEIRSLTFEFGVIVTKQAKEEDSPYSMYYEFSEKVKTLPGHRVLAINRGEKEEFLKVDLQIDQDLILNYLFSEVVTKQKSPAYTHVYAATVDSYERLIAPSIEREIRAQLFDDASEGAIKLFSKNLKQLLLQPPVKGKVALGLDPGYRTGCKLAVVDATGKVLDTAVIYPTIKSDRKYDEAKVIVKKLLAKYKVEIIAIGNGTASRESEQFIVEVLKETDTGAKYNIVSEAGASVYSASKLGAEEFPDFDVTQRSAVSIARRLQDPLAELVKIEPKAIGVGQYQHDMKPARLDEALTGVVEDCVNSVGVDVNTASYSLLSYVSGINAASAKNIVKYREENGEFKSRAQIKKVPRIGDKA
ncbi:MAG: RNA-binding transcriptional accessory protein, partial [Ruminococcaceae bacterium]|nr:RNA-binding transcriptional accessory protein [Oscillospiraceae bacterium]